ncbi:MAG: hypothetical protein KBG33_05410 [Paludibacteraceae bacterium]|nr:hypothetical protein [Paludibacteraceae bacterium]OPZ03445.1 MAG: hypothetical protein BWZ11_00053 [Bacteroidetes bacterium ADurb.BinA395]
MKSTKGFLLLLTFLGFSCSVYMKENFRVVFPFPNDSSYIRINGLYKNFGKILHTKDNHTTIEKYYISGGYKVFKPSIIELLTAERLMFEKKIKVL